MPELTRVGDIELVWGESLRWDDRRQRLYFVDCANQTLYWLDDGGPRQSLKLASMPAGVVLTDEDALVVCLEDGLYVVDPDTGTSELLAKYPDAMHGRANDANADGSGNLVTGTLNLGPGDGAAFWFSAAGGWRLIDDGITNTNGPLVLDLNGRATLILADTPAGAVYAYDYDGRTGAVGDRRVFGDHSLIGGTPDGATADARQGVWSCVLGSGKIARFCTSGLDRLLDVPMANPSDVCFGGPNLDRLYIASIAVDLGNNAPLSPEDGWLMVADGIGVVGVPEARFHFAS